MSDAAALSFSDLLRAVWPKGTVKSAARAAGVSIHTAHKWVHAGNQPSAGTLLVMLQNEELRAELLQRLGCVGYVDDGATRTDRTVAPSSGSDSSEARRLDRSTEATTAKTHPLRVVTACLALALAFGSPAQAAAPAPGSESAEAFVGHEAWITGQHSPGGQFCCDLSDGRVAELRKRGTGWDVYYAKATWSDGTDKWLAVPDNAVLAQQSPIYVPIAWIMGGRVYCLALAGAS